MSSTKKIDVNLIDVPVQAYEALAALSMILPNAIVLNALNHSIKMNLRNRQIICRQRKRGKRLEVVGEFKGFLLALRMCSSAHANRATVPVRILRENEPYNLTAAIDAEIAEALAMRAYITCAETCTALVLALSDANRTKLVGSPPLSQRKLVEFSRLSRKEFHERVEPTQPAGVWAKIVSLDA